MGNMAVNGMRSPGQIGLEVVNLATGLALRTASRMLTPVVGVVAVVSGHVAYRDCLKDPSSEAVEHEQN